MQREGPYPVPNPITPMQYPHPSIAYPQAGDSHPSFPMEQYALIPILTPDEDVRDAYYQDPSHYQDPSPQSMSTSPPPTYYSDSPQGGTTMSDDQEGGWESEGACIEEEPPQELEQTNAGWGDREGLPWYAEQALEAVQAVHWALAQRQEEDQRWWAQEEEKRAREEERRQREEEWRRMIERRLEELGEATHRGLAMEGRLEEEMRRLTGGQADVVALVQRELATQKLATMEELHVMRQEVTRLKEERVEAKRAEQEREATMAALRSTMEEVHKLKEEQGREATRVTLQATIEELQKMKEEKTSLWGMVSNLMGEVDRLTEEANKTRTQVHEVEDNMRQVGENHDKDAHELQASLRAVQNSIQVLAEATSSGEMTDKQVQVAVAKMQEEVRTSQQHTNQVVEALRRQEEELGRITGRMTRVEVELGKLRLSPQGAMEEVKERVGELTRTVEVVEKRMRRQVEEVADQVRVAEAAVGEDKKRYVRYADLNKVAAGLNEQYKWAKQSHNVHAQRVIAVEAEVGKLQRAMQGLRLGQASPGKMPMGMVRRTEGQAASSVPKSEGTRRTEGQMVMCVPKGEGTTPIQAQHKEPRLKLMKRVVKMGATTVSTILTSVESAQAPRAEGPSPQEAMVRQVGSAIHAVPTASTTQSPTTPATTALLPWAISTIRKPRQFTGEAVTWGEWRKEWMRYLKDMEDAIPGLTDQRKVKLLEEFVDEATAIRLREEVDSKVAVDYETVWHELDLSFGAANREVLRQQLRSTRLQHRGKLTEAQWRAFYIRVTSLAAQVPDVTESEVVRIIMEQLPRQPWRRKIWEETEKKKVAFGLLVEGLPQDTTEEDVQELVESETGKRATLVEKTPKGFRLRPRDEVHMKEIKKAFDRQGLSGGELLQVGPEEVDPTPAQIDRSMVGWLRLEQKVEGTGEAQAPEKPRVFQRELRVAGDEEEEEDGVRQVQQKIPPKAPPKEPRKEKQDKVQAQTQTAPPSTGKGEKGGGEWWTGEWWSGKGSTPPWSGWKGGRGSAGWQGGYKGGWGGRGGDGYSMTPELGSSGKGRGEGKGEGAGKGKGQGDAKGGKGRGWQE